MKIDHFATGMVRETFFIFDAIDINRVLTTAISLSTAEWTKIHSSSPMTRDFHEKKEREKVVFLFCFLLLRFETLFRFSRLLSFHSIVALRYFGDKLNVLSRKNTPLIVFVFKHKKDTHKSFQNKFEWESDPYGERERKGSGSLKIENEKYP